MPAKTMKALLCFEHGLPDSLRYADAPIPEPGPGEVRIRVAVAGVNFPDGLIVQNKYQFKPDLPFSPGGEASGLIDALGPDVTGFTLGQRVAALTLYGAFAEYVIAKADMTYPVPDAMDLRTAGCFTFTYGTSYHGLKQRAQLQAGETVLVLGAAGGVGLAAVELAKAAGARVIAAASTAEKLQVAKNYGADEGINYAEEDIKDAVKALVGKKGVDVIYDPVGDSYAEPAFRTMGWGGRYLVVGFAGGKVPSLPLNLPLLKGASIMGVFWGDFVNREPDVQRSNMEELFALCAAGKLRPLISETFALEDGAQAINWMMDRKAKGKILITVADLVEASPVSQPILSVEAYTAMVGQELGLSDWVLIDQPMIDAFADVTDDHQYIHVDPEAARNTPMGCTIAHGFLILSLLPSLRRKAGVPVVEGMAFNLNYGGNRVRFTAPVPVGSRIRGRFTLTSFTQKGEGRYAEVIENRVEIEGQEKPALVAEWISLKQM